MGIYLNFLISNFSLKKENNLLDIFNDIRETEKRNQDINLKFAGFLIRFNNQNRIYIFYSFNHLVSNILIILK